MIQRSKDLPGVIGARITGGGFGGCLVMLTEKYKGRTAAEHLMDDYRHRFGLNMDIIVPEK